jgi:hypothetical protein
MKYCPQCNQSYEDDSYNYCLNDRAELLSYSEMQEAETLKVSADEVPTEQLNITQRKEYSLQRVARVEQTLKFKKEREEWLTSKIGVDAAAREIESLFDELERLVTQINKDHQEVQIEIRGEAADSSSRTLHCMGFVLSITWKPSPKENSIEGAMLEVELKGDSSSPHITLYTLDMDEERRIGWREERERSQRELISSSELSDRNIDFLMNRVERSIEEGHR